MMVLRKLLLQEVLFMLSKKRIREFIKGIDPEIKVKFGKDNYFDPHYNYISIYPENEYLPSFRDHLVNTHKCSWADEFLQITWSILHEIGHYYTDDPNDETDFLLRLYYGCDENITDEDYYNLSSEYNATEWARKFIEDNREYVEEFNNEILDNVKK